MKKAKGGARYNRIFTAVLFLLLLINPGSVHAADFTVHIHGTSSGMVFTFWKIDEKPDNSKYGAMIRRYAKMDSKVLDAKFSHEEHPAPEEGDVTVVTLSEGTYYVREKGRKLAAFFLTLTGSDKHIYPKEEQEHPAGRTHTVILRKEDEEGNMLSGVHFILKEMQGDTPFALALSDRLEKAYGGIYDRTLVTDRNGEVRVGNLPDGTYMFMETQSLPGFEGEGEEHLFRIDGSDAEIVIINRRVKTGGRRFIKTSDDVEAKPLQGAVFQVLRIEEDKWQNISRDGEALTVISEEDGSMLVSDLPIGTYYLYEVAAPKEYIRKEGVYAFEITADSMDKDPMVIVNSKEDTHADQDPDDDLSIPVLPPDDTKLVTPPEQTEILSPNVRTGDRNIPVFLSVMCFALLALVFVERNIEKK